MDKKMEEWVNDYLKDRPEYLLSDCYHRDILSQDKNYQDKDFDWKKFLASINNYHDKDFNREELLALYEKDEWNFKQNLRLRYIIHTAYFMFHNNSSIDAYIEMQKCFDDAREGIIKESIKLLQSEN